MLIRFNVKNFRSFSHRIDAETQEERSQEFSMIPGKSRKKEEHIYTNETQNVLKFGAVYGANASGKSNLIKAIHFMRKLIVDGEIPTGYTEQYCRTHSENKEKNSYFEMELLLEEKAYSYGFEVLLNTMTIVSEWFYELTNDGEDNIIFSRDVASGTYEFAEDLKKIKNLDVYAGDIKRNGNTLFLSVMNKNKEGFYEENKDALILQQLYKWYRNKLDVNSPEKPVYTSTRFGDVDSIDKLSNLISVFGTGIVEIVFREIQVDEFLAKTPLGAQKILPKILKELEKGKNIKVVCRTKQNIFTIESDKENDVTVKVLQFEHRNNVLFNLSEESDGTTRLFDLLEVLMSDEGKTYVIDELDRCLHPALTCKFVKTFLELAEKRKVQLIVTSHESRLLDFDLLRRDEIWFVDKKTTGESDIYSLEEYNERFDKKIDKAYLEGRYGGVPIFSTLFPVQEDSHA